MIGAARIRKRDFYHLGGFANPNLYRKQQGNSWAYYRIYS